MSLDLPAINQPYPETMPWLDVRQYLVNGWVATTAQTFAIRPDGNALDLSYRLKGADATSSIIAEGIPIAPPFNVRFQGYLLGQSVWLSLDQNGIMRITSAGQPPYGDEVYGIARMPRKP